MGTRVNVAGCAAAFLVILLSIAACGTIGAPGPDSAPESRRGPAIEFGGGKIIAFGDSTTAPRDTIDVYASRLARALAGCGVGATVVNAGVPGNSTEDGRARFQMDVLDQDPTLVIIQFGINDSAIDVWRDPPASTPRVSRARYKENLAYVIQELATRKIQAVLMTPNPMRWAEKTRELYNKPPYDTGDADGFNVLLGDYAEAAREVAAETDTPLVDIYAVFQAYDAEAGKSMDDLLLDGMHPNDAGHALITSLLVEAMARKRDAGTAKPTAP